MTAAPTRAVRERFAFDDGAAVACDKPDVLVVPARSIQHPNHLRHTGSLQRLNLKFARLELRQTRAASATMIETLPRVRRDLNRDRTCDLFATIGAQQDAQINCRPGLVLVPSIQTRSRVALRGCSPPSISRFRPSNSTSSKALRSRTLSGATTTRRRRSRAGRL